MNKRCISAHLTMIVVLGSFFIGCKKEASKPEPASPQDEPKSVVLKDEALRIADLKISTARIMSIPISVRVSGTVAFNQEKLAYLTSKVAGRIERVNVYAGEKAAAGQELLSLYSPEFLSAQAEFIQVDNRWKRVAGGADRDEKRTASQIVDSAVNKLMTIGLTEEEIKALKENHEIKPLLAVRAPFSGSIIESAAIPGDTVEFGSHLFEIADLSKLWVMVNIFERDLASLKPGMLSQVGVEAFPGEVFPGRLVLIGDVLEESSRTVKGRVEVQNPAGKLKPGMFSEVRLISTQASSALVVPEKAVQRTEGKNIVFIPLRKNSFLIREVKTGRVLGEYIEILAGLGEGEAVVAEGSFALKSEMLKATLEGE